MSRNNVNNKLFCIPERILDERIQGVYAELPRPAQEKLGGSWFSCGFQHGYLLTEQFIIETTCSFHLYMTVL
ncbi:hypothetical protein BRADI_4g04846v3 [Brachypodium distachyon]|uniref:Uncharacterized protein n=1 Tax=Brachypodium distachyon TaxID=15368 RepID=A0A0Q3IJF2_BRADI|nr:hypothetical protein BRADI_4g04846v3 [Brachypodium distachyon]